ncbi:MULTISPECIES: class I SAM-dependent DNA methyltransferase [Tissierellales]|jgi:SAM-dependent methyltransferase|uniref:Class I SAM-dependent methyltransferase n=1 Tax=Acidilutibacter cellobiosedens TaxID=2507161 RepID=A0A410QBI8_9FIRM|nr:MULTISPECIES: class I SAM-dependent methyltransferase [Tissierellales]MBE6082153.1 class I SAM-dependent methyltransferase [Tissierellaceae bacterium]QAT61327.1 class I SAM-dependent methyltransferase [Acidilutibacter cellobiosedens]SCL95061.1 dTDP-3-amino-3,4, 6-trideoxy-alpha-D-glucopyranose [Sporanaerobacter sp. PP17-6a]
MYNKFAQYYDELMDDVEYEKWYLYIEEILKKENVNGEDVLEMACGTGNMTKYFVKKGYKVISFDSSEDMLSIVYNKLHKYSNLKILNQNMIDFNINKKFDIVICVCDGINYILDENDLQRIFISVNSHLKSGGVFIFDINSFYKLKEIVGNNIFVEDRKDIYYIWQNYFDEKSNIAQFDLTFFAKEKDKYIRFDEEHFERAYSVSEISNLLNKAGFEKVKCYEHPTFSFPDEKSERINFVAGKI